MALKGEGILIWCGAGANHKALAVKIANRFPVTGIVIDDKPAKKKRSIFSILSLVLDRLRFKEIYDAWRKLQSYYNNNFPSWPEVPQIRVPGINCEEAVSFSKEHNPALIIVSGTSLIKEKLLAVPASIGIINLHTGLSPYVKGGPNCTNWCIANNDWHLVGNTIMWINAGIDSGNIIASATVDITESDDLFNAQKLVMEQAHSLYLDVIAYLLTSSPPFTSVSQQSIGKGNLFLTKMWTVKQKINLLRNWKNRRNSNRLVSPVTVSLPRDRRTE